MWSVSCRTRHSGACRVSRTLQWTFWCRDMDYTRRTRLIIQTKRKYKNKTKNTEVENSKKEGRPAKRWEDDLNEFVQEEETQRIWLAAAKKVYEWGKKKNNTRSTLSKTEEPNFAHHHDGIPFAHPSTNDDFQQQQHHQQPQGNH